MDKRQQELSNYRLEQAERCVKSAKILAADNDYKGAANRSYYAIFHCMRSVLALEGVDFSKHSGVSSYFRKQYIKTGIFDIELSNIVKEAFDIRNDNDYDDYYILSKDDVEKQIENAQKFYIIKHKKSELMRIMGNDRAQEIISR